MIFNTKPSIRRKLILMFFSSSIILYIFLEGIIHYVVQSHFYNLDYQHITEKVNVMKQSTLAKKFDPFTMESSYFSGLEIWIIENKIVTYQNSETILPVKALQFFLKNQNEKRSWEWNNEKDRYLAFSFSVNGNDTLVIGVNINHHVEFFYVLSLIVIWSIVAMSLVSGLCAILIVNNGLRPLKIFESYLTKIHPSQIHVRIPTKKLPIELQTLSKVQNSMLYRLDQGFKKIKDFSSDIAHELRTPLNNMIIQTQVVLSKDRDLFEYQNTLASNLEELERFNKTINDILYLAKSENLLLYKNDEWLNLNEVILPLIEYYNIAVDDKYVQIIMEGEGTIYCDKIMFQRAVNNLLSNAIRHAVPNSIINVIIKQSNSMIEVGIINEGDTISKPSLPFIFDRFYRADKSREHHLSIGAGLGLAITKSIIDTYGASIKVRSENRKTEFWMCFRRTEPKH